MYLQYSPSIQWSLSHARLHLLTLAAVVDLMNLQQEDQSRSYDENVQRYKPTFL